MQQHARTSKKTRSGGVDDTCALHRHPPLDIAALFHAVGFFTEVYHRDGNDIDTLPLGTKTFDITFIDDVSRGLNTFECYRSMDDNTMTLHMHPETRQVLEKLDVDVTEKFFDVNGFCIGLVYFDVNQLVPSVTNFGLRVAAQIRESEYDFACHMAGSVNPCSEEEGCRHACERHCSELDPDWREYVRGGYDPNVRCPCETSRHRVLTYEKRTRSQKRAKTGY